MRSQSDSETRVSGPIFPVKSIRGELVHEGIDQLQYLTADIRIDDTQSFRRVQQVPVSAAKSNDSQYHVKLERRLADKTACEPLHSS